MHKNLVQKIMSKVRIFAGIYLNKVYQGPYQVYVNLTDICNLNCLMCPVYSPLVQKDEQAHPKEYLRRDVLDNLSDSLTNLKVQLVTITGGGEPFLHPHLMDFVRKLCRAKKDVTIVTNGTIIKEEQLTELLRLDVNLRFSLIAASPEKYLEVHPNQTAATFDRLKNTLALIKDFRKKIPSRSVVSILFVIFKNNFHEMPIMLNMGKEYNVDFVHFKPTIFPQEEMKGLFLDDIDLKRLRDIVESVQKTYEISSTDLTSFSDELERNQKLIENHGISDQKRSTPCYKGWTFCWILANGDVVPCCDCNIPLGNINNETFESIWYSKKYYELRRSMTTPHRGIINISACKCDTCKPDSEEIRISKGLQFIRGRGFRRKAI